MEIVEIRQGVTAAEGQRVLVTGATGFVGSALVQEMLKDVSIEVVCSVRESNRVNELRSNLRATASQSSSATRVSIVNVGEIDGDTKWGDALSGVHSVIHLAARVHVMKDAAVNPLAKFRRVNLEGTLNLARQAAIHGVKRFVFLSSVKVNGESGRFSERDSPSPVDYYGISKFEAETGLREIETLTGMEVVIVRPPLVYGPGVKANFQSLMRLVQKGIPLPLGAVRNRRSFVAIDNLVSLLLVCIRHPRAAGRTFFVSDGFDLSTTELLQRMATALGKRGRLIPVPPGFVALLLSIVGRKAMAQRLLDSLQVDILQTRQVLEWTPPVSVDEALRRTAAAL